MMTEKLAYFISFILNPLFVLVFLPFFIVYRATYSFVSAISWTAYSFLFLLVVGLFMLYGVKIKLFSDLDISRREERPLFFLFLILMGIIYISGLFMLDAPVILKAMAIGMMVGVFVVSIVNMKIKASLHLAILSALILGVFLGYGGYTILFFLLIPLIAWARVKIRRHTPLETVVGWIVGSVVSWGIYSYIRTFIYI
jgi:hypothetical protein